MQETSFTEAVRSGFLKQGQRLPLVIEPGSESLDLAAFITQNLAGLEANLLKYGAILFRGFSVDAQEYFERFVEAIFPQPMQYIERSTPRIKLSDRVYTSTEYPASRSIALHNESSYSSVWPGKVCFFCLKPADEQGETPIADVRNVYNRIDPAVVNRFVQRQWMLLRNYNEGAGLSWQDGFQTKERSVVEDYCRSYKIEFEWIEDGGLRTRQVRPAVARHPKTGETVWFNHIAFWHISSLDHETAKAMLDLYGDEGLPYNTYFGDGAPIEPSIVAQLREAYEQEKVVFPWRKGDVLVLDNMLAAHGRNPYRGTRKVLVAMGEPRSGQDVRAAF